MRAFCGLHVTSVEFAIKNSYQQILLTKYILQNNCDKIFATTNFLNKISDKNTSNVFYSYKYTYIKVNIANSCF